MNETQKLLKISPDKLKAFNSVLLDPNSQVIKDFFAVVAKYGTPKEINRKHRAARKMDNLFKIVEERNPDALKDLKWLIEQRDRNAFISVKDYRRNILGGAADKMKFKDKYAITLPDALASLNRLCLLNYAIDTNTTVTRLPKTDARQKEILVALGVSIKESRQTPIP